MKKIWLHFIFAGGAYQTSFGLNLSKIDRVIEKKRLTNFFLMANKKVFWFLRVIVLIAMFISLFCYIGVVLAAKSEVIWKSPKLTKEYETFYFVVFFFLSSSISSFFFIGSVRDIIFWIVASFGVASTLLSICFHCCLSLGNFRSKNSSVILQPTSISALSQTHPGYDSSLEPGCNSFQSDENCCSPPPPYNPSMVCPA